MPVLPPSIVTALKEAAPWQEELFEQLHQAPELSMQETRTLAEIVSCLKEYGYDVVEVGGGAVGILRNGEGPTVLFRADIDALPVKEETGLPYASTATQVDRDGVEQHTMHACGHDFHIVGGLGAAKALAEHREEWSGTYLALFQPAEETAEGAQSMVDAGLVSAIPTPDVALGQHILTAPEAGKVTIKSGAALSTATSMKILIKGAGSHGSMPHLGVDPVVLASAVVTRIQTLVSREVSPSEFGVVTVGSFQSGSKANIIPDTATLLLNFRAYSEENLQHLIEGVQRIARAEAEAARAEEPEFETFDVFPLTNNDETAADKVEQAFIAQFGEDRVVPMEPITASEDFSNVPRAFGVPYLFWGVGGYAEGRKAWPNHSPKWSPDKQPTLTVATEAATTAILAYLGTDA